jgi:hypothetical protein
VNVNLYNPANPVGLAFAYGLVMFALALAAYWRHCQADHMLVGYKKHIFDFALSGVVTMLLAVDVLITTIRIDDKVYLQSDAPFPTTSIGTYLIAIGLVAAAAFRLTESVKRHNAIQTAAATTGLFATVTFGSYAMFLNKVQLEEWTLLTTAGWLLTGVSLVALVVTTVVVQIRAYGKRQFAAGQAQGLRQPVLSSVDVV